MYSLNGLQKPLEELLLLHMFVSESILRINPALKYTNQHTDVQFVLDDPTGCFLG
jgi:hypothetical protein